MNFRRLAQRSFFGIIAIFIVVTFFNLFNFNKPSPNFVDFNFLYFIGSLSWNGQITNAYDPSFIEENISRVSAEAHNFLWLYPPPYAILLSFFSLLPISISYLLYIVPFLIFYLFLIKTFSGQDAIFFYYATLPAILVNIQIGQNGFITATLFGLFALASFKKSYLDGLWWSLICCKPQLAITPFVSLLSRAKWKSLVIGIIFNLLAVCISTFTYGAETWLKFFECMKSVGNRFWDGQSPSYRMTSLYVSLSSLGIPSSICILLQLFSAGLIVCIIFFYAKRSGTLKQKIGLTILGSNGISPYVWDYDMLVSGIGLSILWPFLKEKANNFERSFIFLLTGFMSGFYNIIQFIYADIKLKLYGSRLGVTETTTTHFISLGGIAYWLLILLTLYLIQRKKLE